MTYRINISNHVDPRLPPDNEYVDMILGNGPGSERCSIDSIITDRGRFCFDIGVVESLSSKPS